MASAKMRPNAPNAPQCALMRPDAPRVHWGAFGRIGVHWGALGCIGAHWGTLGRILAVAILTSILLNSKKP